jgi:Domain of Unknown Function (DUF1080)
MGPVNCSFFRKPSTSPALQCALFLIALIAAVRVDGRGSQDTPPADVAPADPIVLFDGKSMDRWEIADFGGQDRIEVIDGAIVCEPGYPIAGIRSLRDDLPTNDYMLELEAQKIDGTDFFCCLTFPVNDGHLSLVLGGWGGTTCGLSCLDEKDAAHNETRFVRRFPREQWFRIQIRMSGNRVVASIDGEEVVNADLAGRKISLRSEVLRTTPIGICAFETKAAWRNIRVTRIAPDTPANPDPDKREEPDR